MVYKRFLLYIDTRPEILAVLKKFTMLMLVQVYCILTVSLEYCVPLAAMTLAYIRVGRRLWGAQTPGQVQIIQVAMSLAYST